MFTQAVFLIGELMNSFKKDSDNYKETGRISENRGGSFNSVFENMQTGMAIVDIEGTCLKVNSRLCEMLDYSEPELTGNGFSKLICPEESEIASLFLDKISKEYLEIHGKETCFTRKNGNKIWISISASLAIDHEKRPLYFVFQIEDITRQKAAELSLGDSERKFELIFENAGDGMAINEPGGKFLKVNRITCEKMGYSKEELLEKTATELVSSESAEFFVQQVRELYQKGHAVAQIMAVCKDGSTLPVEMGMRVIEYEGRPALLSIVRDLTGRIKAEEETKIRNAAMDSALNPMVICSLAGCITYVNPAFLKTWGYSTKNEVFGKQITSFWCSGEKTDVMKRLFSDGVWAGELIACGKDNNKFPVHLSASFVKEEAGNPICMMGSFLNISKHKEVEQMMIEARLRAEAASLAKSNFLASMSHELRTPLNSIIGFADVLKEKTFGPLNDRQEKYLNNISISGKHLLKLIDDILDLSKVEAGKMELNPEEFSMPETFREIEATLKPLALKRNIKMVWGKESELKIIRADRTKFKQILYNLIDNAIKFSPQNGLIKIDTQTSEDNISISVTDSGPGISTADQKNLFEPFSQLGKFESREQSGTGLGLVIVKKFVELHGGKIWLESMPGKGSKFSFMIPLVRE